MNGSPWISKKPLGRRTLLRGAGAAVALPFLESMAPIRASAPAPPKRYVALFAPNGMLPEPWRPKTVGTDFELPPTLAPLAPVRDSVTVLGNLRNRNSFAGEGHYVKTTAWLSGAKVERTGGRDLRVGTSIDQVLAQRFARRTPIDSLVLGIEPVRNRVDMGYSTVYGANVSWRTPTTPAAREIAPRRAFDRLVRWSGVRSDPRRSRVLDLVHGEAKRLSAKLGGADRDKVGEYLASVDELEKRIDALSARAALDLHGDAPEHDRTYEAKVRAMLDLVVLALRTDSSRFATFMFANSVSNQNFSFLDGVEGGHHSLSHHEKKDDKKAQYALINRWHVARLAEFLGALKAVPEGDGTLLDRSIVQFGSGIADGNAHNPRDLPVLVCGGLLGGRGHVRPKDPTPLCNLYVDVLRAIDPEAEDESFSDSTGPLLG